MIERRSDRHERGVEGASTRAKAPAPTGDADGDGAVVLKFPIRGVPEIEPLVDKRQLAAMTGLSVSWVEKRSGDPDFPSYKIGRSRRFRISEVEAYFRRHGTPAARRRRS